MDNTVVIKKGNKPAEQTPPHEIQLDETRVVAQQSTIVLSKTGAAEALPNTQSQEQESKIDAKKSVEVGDCIKSRFDLLEVLGIGGMGVVYRARDLRQKELGDEEPYLAFKVLADQLLDNEDALVALQQESKKTQKLAHPNIVNVHDFDREGDVVYITMELLHGRSLDQVISETGANKNYEQLIPWVSEMCSALIYAHSHHIVHSDFKPSNVFLTDSGVLKVFDFGIARATKSISSSESTLSALTPAYASYGMLKSRPPQYSDDLYALAIVVYMLLTGKHPYQKKSAIKVVEQKLLPSRPEGLPDHAWKTLREALDPLRCERLTVQSFYEHFIPNKRSLPQKLMMPMGVAISLIIIGFGVLGIRWYEEDHFAMILATGSIESVQTALEDLSSLSSNRQNKILLQNRDALISNSLVNIRSKVKKEQLIEAKHHGELMLSLYGDSKVLVAELASLNELIEKSEHNLSYEINGLELQLLDFGKEHIKKWFLLLDRLNKVALDNPLLVLERIESVIVAIVHSLLYREEIALAKLVLSMAEDRSMLSKSKSELYSKVSRYQVGELSQLKIYTGLADDVDSFRFDDEIEKELAAISSKETAVRDSLPYILNRLKTSNPSYGADIQWALERYIKKRMADHRSSKTRSRDYQALLRTIEKGSK